MKQLFPWQKELLEKTKDLPFYAIEWEMRLGKTLPAILTASYLHELGKVDAALIIAPGDVAINWSRMAIMKDANDYQEWLDFKNKFPKQLIAEWHASKAGTKKFSNHMESVLEFPGMVWFCVNTEAIITNNLEQYLEKFLKRRKVMMICDESHRFKNPAAQCTRTAIWLSKEPNCLVRRNLTGTPVTQGPFDLWSQYHILSPYIFHEMVEGKKKPQLYTAFKTRYGIFENKKYGSGPWHAELKDYKDLDHLYSIIEPYRSRITRAEKGMDIPPQHIKRLFVMAKHQQRVYDELRDELITRLDSGEEITAQQAIVCLLRLQQISRGFVSQKIEDGEKLTHDLGKPYPSIDMLVDDVNNCEGKVIIWCRFTDDIELILNRFEEEGIKAIRYDGKVKKEDRFILREKFKSDDNKCLVGNARAGGIGTDMTAASTMIFYSHSYNYEEREQALSRIQGINQKAENLFLIDYVCDGTNDERCLEILDRKENLADLLTGDTLREMLTRQQKLF